METLIPDYSVEGKLIGFKYPYRECAKTFLGICTKWELVEVKFPAEDPAKMIEIKAQDFVLIRRRKP